MLQIKFRVDGLRYKCKNNIISHKKTQKCGSTLSFRSGTFFERSKLSLFKIMAFVNHWVGNASIILIGEQLELGHPTCVDWSSFCREVLLIYFIDKKEKLGGPGQIVEIDESKFGKRKYHRGHYVEGQWVFGGYERETGRVFMVTVEERLGIPT